MKGEDGHGSVLWMVVVPRRSKISSSSMSTFFLFNEHASHTVETSTGDLVHDSDDLVPNSSGQTDPDRLASNHDNSTTPLPTPSTTSRLRRTHPQPQWSFFTPLSDDEDHLDVNYHSEPLWYYTMESILHEEPEPELHQVREDGDPRSFAKADEQASWCTAMKQDMEAVKKNET